MHHYLSNNNQKKKKIVTNPKQRGIHFLTRTVEVNKSEHAEYVITNHDCTSSL